MQIQQTITIPYAQTKEGGGSVDTKEAENKLAGLSAKYTTAIEGVVDISKAKDVASATIGTVSPIVQTVTTTTTTELTTTPASTEGESSSAGVTTSESTVSTTTVTTTPGPSILMVTLAYPTLNYTKLHQNPSVEAELKSKIKEVTKTELSLSDIDQVAVLV